MNNPQKNNFKNLKICDTHIHLIYPETINSTEKIFREVKEYFGYDRIALMCMTTGSGHRNPDPANNVKALYLKDKFNKESPDSTFVYGNPIYYYDERDTADGLCNRAKALYDMGVDGFKFLDGKPSFRKKLARKLCDPIYDKMFAFAEEKGIPVKMHIADPPKYWGPKEEQTEYAIMRGWWCGDGTFPSFQDLHDEVYGILEKFPKLKFCAAHCFYLGHDIEQMTEFFEKWENTSFDLTPGQFNLLEFTKKPDEWKAFFKKYAHRIFFGTDTYNQFVEGDDLSKYDNCWSAPTVVRKVLEKSPEEAFDAAIGHLVPLNLDDKTLSEVYFGSHEKLHPNARPLNKELILNECKSLLKAIKNREFKLKEEFEYQLETDNLEQIIKYFS